MADVEGAVVKAQINVKVDNWQEAVRASCRPLLEADAIEERYVESCIELVEDQGPYIVVAPGIALVHARPEDGAKQLCLCATTLAEAVDFGHRDNDPVDLAFAFGSPDDSLHIGLLKRLAEELQGDLAERLRGAERAEHAESLVKEIIQDVTET